MKGDPIQSRQKLYDSLKKEGLYTKTKQEFDAQFSTPDQAQKLHVGLVKQGLYTKNFSEFNTQFFGSAPQTQAKTSAPAKTALINSAENTLPQSERDALSQSIGGAIDKSKQDPDEIRFESSVKTRAQSEEKGRMQELLGGEKYLTPQQEADRADLPTNMGKTFWNVMTKQIPSGFASLTSLSNKFAEKRTNNPDKAKEYKEYQKSALQTAQRLNKEGARLTENTVNSIDKIENPWDMFLWAANAGTQAGTQIPLSVASGGSSSLVQEVGSIYLSSVERIAKEKGLTAQQVIDQDLDEPAAAITFGTAAAILDRVGAGGVLKGPMKEGFKQTLKQRAKQMLAAGVTIEGPTEYVQTWLEQIGTQTGGGNSFTDALKIAASTGGKERLEALAQGIVGGVAGSMATSAAEQSQSVQQTVQENAVNNETITAEQPVNESVVQDLQNQPPPVESQEFNTSVSETPAQETEATVVPSEEIKIDQSNKTSKKSNTLNAENKNQQMRTALDESRIDTISPIDIKTSLDNKFDNKPVRYYDDQFVPINYQTDKPVYWTSDRDIILNDGANGYQYDISKGDEVYLSVDSPANGDSDSATSYKLVNVTKGKSYPLLNIVPDSVDGGQLSDDLHYDAITQIKNLENVLSGKSETQTQSKERKVKILSEQIPDNDFYVYKPKHSGGFESAQLVQVKDGKYRRLRGSRYETAEDLNKATREQVGKDLYSSDDEESFNVWGDYATKEDVAWDVYHNARVILNKPNATDEQIGKAWDRQYKRLNSENRSRYESSRNKTTETENNIQQGGVSEAQDLRQGANEVTDTEAIQEESVNNSVSEESNSGFPVVEEVAPAVEEVTEGKTLPKESTKHSVGSDVNYEWAGFTKKGKIVEDLGTKVKIKSSDGVTHRVDKAALNGLPKKSEKLIADLEEIVNPKKAKGDSKATKGTSGIVPVSFNPLLIAKEAWKLLNRGQQETIAKYVSRPLENATARIVNKGLESRYKALRSAVSVLKNLMGGLSYTEADTKNKLAYQGGKNFAHLKAIDMADSMYKAIDKDPESLKRIHSILDPEVYQGTPQQGLKINDLTATEAQLLSTIRTANDFIHEWYHDQGLISDETYNKNKGTYIARLYEEFELLPPDVQQQMLKSRADFNMLKQRKEFGDVKSTILSDPVFATVKRMAQMMQTQALFDYADGINNSKTIRVSDTEFPNSTQLGKPGDKPYYGSLTGKFVPNYIAEDFKGFFFTNHILQKFYEAFRSYDKTTIRQFMKKAKTVYNPIVQLGNFFSNFSFSWWGGIDPITYSINMPKAIKEIKNKGPYFQELVKEGIIGFDAVTQDLVQNKGGKLFSGADDIASKLYQGTDDAAKLSAYISLRDSYGYSKEESLRTVYESFQNYATVGKLYDFASKTPVFGNPYIKFKADLGRILKNSITRRPLTTMAYLGLYVILKDVLSDASDEDEDVKKVRERRPFTPKIKNTPFGDISMLWQVPGIGEVNLARFMSPYYLYDVGDQGDAVAEATSWLPYQWKQADISASKDISAFLPDQSDVLIGPWVQAIVLDRDFRGKSIRDPKGSQFITVESDPSQQTLNVMNYIARSQVPMFRSTQDLVSSYNGEADYYDRERTVAQAVLNNIIKVQEFGKDQAIDQLEKEIRYKVSKFEGHTRDIAQLKNVAKKDIVKIQQSQAPEDRKQARIGKVVKELEGEILKRLELQKTIVKQLEEPSELLKTLD
jgi:hypothetical protein